MTGFTEEELVFFRASLPNYLEKISLLDYAVVLLRHETPSFTCAYVYMSFESKSVSIRENTVERKFTINSKGKNCIPLNVACFTRLQLLQTLITVSNDPSFYRRDVLKVWKDFKMEYLD